MDSRQYFQSYRQGRPDPSVSVMTRRHLLDGEGSCSLDEMAMKRVWASPGGRHCTRHAFVIQGSVTVP